MSFSDYLENALLDHVFGSTTFTKPAGLHVALMTTAAADAGGGTEVSTSGTGYTRRTATFTTSGTNPTRSRNAATVTFGPFTADLPAPVVGFAVYDAASGGNLLAHGTFTVGRTYLNGDSATFNVNDLEIRLD